MWTDYSTNSTTPVRSGPNFIELLSTKNAQHAIASLIKTGLPTKLPFVAYCLLLSCCLLILKIMWKFGW